MKPFTFEQLCTCFAKMSQLWNEGITLYTTALADVNNPHHIEELSCAEMIGCHLAAVKNIFEFHTWRRRKMHAGNLAGPCRLPGDAQSAAIIENHLQVMKKALELAKNDSRLGYHQEPHEYFYTSLSISAAIIEMQDQMR